MAFRCARAALDRFGMMAEDFWKLRYRQPDVEPL